MFEHFTFGAQAQTRPQEDWDASPTDISCSEPPSASSTSFPFNWEESQPELGSIVQQMSRQSLSHESETSQPSIWQTTLPSPITDFDDNCDPFNIEDLAFVSTTRGMAKVKAGYSDAAPMTLQAPSNHGRVACRRVQRQRNTQMQACAKHVRDISALVEDMVDGNSQCTLHKTTSNQNLWSPQTVPAKQSDDKSIFSPLYFENRGISPDPNPEDDEGFAEMEEQITALKEELSLRRCTPSGIRKHSGLKYRGSIEGMNSQLVVNGKLKVRSMPRMRKRNRILPVAE
ncbi:hypothetical protein GLAREA_03196 [Glarea lozoyensis ATCC 20868]|uniref:Uncharacterized protein n=1 Tax=Glarea lozoyensis (strain ATCC 20868 / MF5171) TaxID=1116229 RepID=S3D5F0_GLAL2|nr:uncharacterized protein GLAREA_03196 [Glarea lozoyensis ATCC 20868]EPE27281.1 hypothetical protein GLAREA_03196 [Glarea lozoyensis ATCC 20868]